MRHIAIPARSVNADRPYTATGLGDRIHSCIVGWCIGPPVTLHLTADKSTGGRYGNKSASWDEILALFPPGSLAVCRHDVSPRTEEQWLSYLRGRGYDVQSYTYRDFPGPREAPATLDVAALMASIPPLVARPQPIDLPERFVTVQWDAGSPSRQLTYAQRRAVLERYNCEAVVVGGESRDDRLRWSLEHIAYAMSRAMLHVGVDSAFFHMAQLYLPWERIHLYSPGPGSHHAKRARAYGSPVNLYL